MLKIFITQRVDVIESYGERRDALDQSWGECLEGIFYQESILLQPVANRPASANLLLNTIKPDLVVLSGGNDISVPGDECTSPERDETEMLLLEYAARTKTPVLGVCRGLQMINAYLGGGLEKATGHVCVDHEIHSPESPVRKIMVNSFHNYVISKESLSHLLIPLYVSKDDFVEAARHIDLPWLGIMWHPERKNVNSDEQAGIIRKYFIDIFSKDKNIRQ